MKARSGVACAVVALVLAGCGGGGGGDSGPALSVDGFWSGDEFALLVTPTGEVWGVEAVEGSTSTYALLKGVITTSGTSFTVPFTRYFGSDALSATASGSFDPKATLSGTVTAPGVAAAPFSSVYDSAYEGVPNLASLAGTYDYSSGTLTLTSTGGLSGLSEGCAFNGHVTPDASGKNFYRVALTFGPSPCELPGAAASGVLVQSEPNQLVGGVLSGDVGQAIVLTRQPEDGDTEPDPVLPAGLFYPDTRACGGGWSRTPLPESNGLPSSEYIEQWKREEAYREQLRQWRAQYESTGRLPFELYGFEPVMEPRPGPELAQQHLGQPREQAMDHEGFGCFERYLQSGVQVGASYGTPIDEAMPVAPHWSCRQAVDPSVSEADRQEGREMCPDHGGHFPTIYTYVR